MQRRSTTLIILTASAIAWLPVSAHANGQSTHLWITDDARTHVPPGPLAEFVGDPALDRMMRNGTMFPDGGYPLGDPYAEIAHWEPFQISFLDWIMAHYDPPYTGEGAEHLAFLLGMASHGMADQVFDSLYGERVKAYDGDFGDFDTASDLIMMSHFEPMMAPSDWVPYTVFDQLYDAIGYDVDPAVMMDGQNLLRIAVNAVAIFSQMPEQVADASIPFPWGSQHLLDETVPGAPPCEGEVIARYWRVLWAIAHEQVLPGPVLATIPADGGANHPSDSSSESWVSVVFSRGLEMVIPPAMAMAIRPAMGTGIRDRRKPERQRGQRQRVQLREQPEAGRPGRAAPGRGRAQVERPSPTSPKRRRSIRPAGVNRIPSASSRDRCSSAAAPVRLISPRAFTTRCHGSVASAFDRATSSPGFGSGAWLSTRPTRRARPGRPASAAT